MKAKTIKAVLRKKINEWLESIEDEDVRELAAQNTIVTGGSIASMLLRENINDFDLYFKTKETCKAIAEYYVERFKESPPPKFKDSDETLDVYVKDQDGRIRIAVRSAGIASADGETDYEFFEADPDADAITATEYVETAMSILEEVEDKEKPPYRPVFLTSNAITLSHKVQLVVRFYGEPDEIHSNYDFVHVTNYWKSWDNELVLRKDALEALLARELRYMGSKYPLCSIIRTRKFIGRNWTINAGQYLKMAMQLNDLDLTDIVVLEDQLIGVDAAYFMEIIRKLKERDKTKVDSAYLLEIIDRVF